LVEWFGLVGLWVKSQVGVFLYALSLTFEWGAVIILRYTEPDMPRPYVIPMRNWVLCAYFTVPVLLCFFTMSTAFFEKQDENGGKDWNVIIAVGGTIVAVVLLYGSYMLARWVKGLPVHPEFPTTMEGAEPLLGTLKGADGITTNI
jgi:amino acid transporter